MKDRFLLEIVTPKGLIFSGDVKSAQFPGSEGELGVMPNHASLITLLSTGLIEVVDLNGEKDVVAINWGYLKISEEKVTVLADGAVYVSGKANSSMKDSMDKAKELIESMGRKEARPEGARVLSANTTKIKEPNTHETTQTKEKLRRRKERGGGDRSRAGKGSRS